MTYLDIAVIVINCISIVLNLYACKLNMDTHKRLKGKSDV